MPGKRLEEVQWDNLVLRDLPVDITGDAAVRQVRGACFTNGLAPTPVQNPQLVAASADVLQLLGIAPEEADRPDFAAIWAGNKLLPGWQPAAACYAGHQFGYFSGQLGDGAAMYLGEMVNDSGERWEVQLKGSGLTPYSRQADGRKASGPVLRSSIREFLASEAMAGLGIPTTRAAALVTSDTRVVRDPLYDGRIVQERASVVTRVAPTFLRFGSFEIFKATDPVTGRTGPSAGLEATMLPQMVDFTIRTYYPDIWAAHGGDADLPPQQKQTMIAEWFRQVARRTGRLVALWQCVGWVHGVLNTDNMSIVGLTLDYGPYRFMDRADLDLISNGSDDSGRYDYKGQPAICRWNLERLVEALAPLVPGTRLLREANEFEREYDSTYWGTMRRKLGLLVLEEAADRQLIEDLIHLMVSTGADWTRTWRRLSKVGMAAPLDAAAAAAPAGDESASAATAGPASEAEAQRPRGGGDSSGGGATTSCIAFLEEQLADLADPATMAEATKPRIPGENLHMLATLAGRDPGMLHALGTTAGFLARELERLKTSEHWASVTPDAKRATDATQWRAWLHRYSERLAREAAAGGAASARAAAMRGVNPRVVLRNWVAEEAIRAAEAGDFSKVCAVLEDLRDPYSQGPEEYGDIDGAAADSGPSCRLRFDVSEPDWARNLCVTCSS